MFVNYKSSWDKRALALLLAVAVVFVGLPFVGVDTSLKASADGLSGDGNAIYSDTKTTTIKTNNMSSNDTRFNYTGNITRAQTTLFDYVSDYELINNSYNNINHTEGGYDDAYTSFNSAISQSGTTLYESNDNITITLNTTSFDTDVYVYLWRVEGSNTTNNNTWPGNKMTYDSVNHCFTYTFNCSDFSSSYSLGFIPNRLIFNDNMGNQSPTLEMNGEVGKTYAYSFNGGTKIKYCYNNQAQNANASSGFYVHYWKDNNGTEWPGIRMTAPSTTNGNYVYEVDTTTLGYIPKRFIINNNGGGLKSANLPYDSDKAFTTRGFIYYVYKYNNALKVESQPAADFTLLSSNTAAQPIYYSEYTNPLYFGCFWRSNTADYSTASDPGYTSSNKPGSNLSYGPYNNFWWQVNMGLKPYATKGSASVQGLVYKSLINDNLADVNGTTELPYFDKNSNLVTKGLMKYYDQDDTGDNIQFPFYEVRSNAQSNVGSGNSKLAGTYKAYSGTGTAKTQYAKFYQFDSKESNVRFEIKNDNPDTHTGHFVETNQAITHDSKAGYFPLNNVNKSDETQHNLGIGTKFEMSFKLQEDGCVGVVDIDGNDLDPNEYKSRVHTIFEFEGDDDLWVFIDGNLVLDMGGAHLKSQGVIDFADKTATVSQAITVGEHRTLNYTGNDKDDLDAAVHTNSQVNNTNNAFNSALKAGSFTDADNRTTNEGGTKYDTSVTHTITVFYMERGMLDSNLLVRFNYTPESNFSKMKIAEVTSVDNVNDGLKNLTLKAAENDVFSYTIKNNNTNGDDPKTNSAVFPKGVKSIRSNMIDSNLKTQLTPESTAGTVSKNFKPTGSWDTNHLKWTSNGEEVVKDTSYLWVDEFADNPKITGLTDSGGNFSLMFGTCQDLYPSSGTAKVGKESSAEFEKQFSRNSTMRVLQSDTLYSPDRANSTLGLFSDNANVTGNKLTATSRKVSDYYDTSVVVKDREKNIITLNNDSTFNFNNDSKVDSNLSVMLTEYFTNTVKTSSLKITKKINGPTTNTKDTDYTFNLKLTEVFGDSNVNVSDYSKIVVSKTGEAGTSTSISSNGTFTLKRGQTITISGIPNGTKYTVTETIAGSPQTANSISGEVSVAKIIDQDGSSVKITNEYDPVEVTVKKTKEGGGSADDLNDAELELWYKETTVAQTYSTNDPQIVPTKKNGMIVSKTVGIPDLEEISTSYTYYTNTSTYSNPDVPSSEDYDWILPRSDADYIYFRDYNVGPYEADKDSTSFNNTTGNRSWIKTNFAANSAEYTHSQDQELDFKNKSLWVAAQFTGNNKPMVQYAVWERFVDKFTYKDTSNNSQTVDTVVWKIQPPDGYTEVRFLVYSGDSCIRTTEKFTYKLGEMYHKTNWGGSYSEANGGSYYNVPVKAEKLEAPGVENNATAISDRRNTSMDQPRKYTPTNNKIIFHCNSQQVWHNIHIEFFTDNNESTRIGGQAFPGYMMEPYAYAGSDYRLSDGYLTYELTIPEGAKYFRINNGVSTGPYSYMTQITEIKNESNKKNGGNYFILGNNYNTSAKTISLYNCISSSTASQDVPLCQCEQFYKDKSSDNTDKTYSDNKITSDYDYVYFMADSSSWGDKVYAYFYGGGNLRDDNWQRACYSAWPGVAPVGTDYEVTGGNDTTVHSNTYSIKTTGNTYNGNDTNGNLSPEATFSFTKNNTRYTVYKFRLPKGDRKNYSKVIFNNGLNGGKETDVIEYHAGYMYTKSGAATKHYDNSPTVTYTARTNNTYSGSDKTEYIYIKNTANFDDPHITFYDSSGNQILQGGCGYVMDYAGSKDSKEYYRMPIPTNAAKFSVNNGIDANGNIKNPTEKCDIIRYSESQSNAAPTSDKHAYDKFVYELSSSDSLTRLGYSAGTPTPVTVTTNTAQTEDVSNYSPNEPNSGVRKTGSTDDTLNIRDIASWDVAIGGVSVEFYDENGAFVGSGVMMKTKADSDSKVWYTKKIPINAKSFAVSYTKGSSPETTTTTTTSKYPIYPASEDTNGNKTISGNMYYQTYGTNELSLINAEVANVEANDETYEKRGDYLYLKCSEEDKNSYWENMNVTFYANGENVIRSGVTAKFVNDDGDDSWYRVSIPKGAESFTVTGGDSPHTTAKADIYELKTKLSRYQKDYTLGDMQYELPSESGGTAAKLLYPIFTEDDEYTLTVGKDNTISSMGNMIPIDTSQISEFANASVETRPETTAANESPVLYNTQSTNVTYKWEETGSGDGKLRFDNSVLSWSTVRATFYYSNGASSFKNMDDDGSSSLKKVDVPEGAVKVDFSKNGSSADGEHTGQLTLPGTSPNAGKNQKYTPNYETVVGNTFVVGMPNNSQNSNDWDGFIYFYNSGGAVGAAFPGTRLSNGGYSGYNTNSYGQKGWKITIPSNASGKADHIILIYWASIGNGRYKFYRTEDYALSNLEVGKGIYGGNSNGVEADSFNGTYDDVPTSIKDGTATKTNFHQYDIPDNFGTIQYKSGGSFSEYGSSGGETTTYTYQPEDRYGMISEQNTNYDSVLGFNDVNNFIYVTIPDSITKPYIQFLDSSNNLINAASSNASAKGLLLNADDLMLNDESYSMVQSKDATNHTTTYRVRLPKNAKTFSICDGTTTGTAFSLYNSITVNASDGQLTSSGDRTEITNFHHAGSTFSVNGTTGTDYLNITLRDVRDSYTAVKNDMEDPLIPKTDADFVFLTLPSGLSGWATPYAYYYGAQDGEYAFAQGNDTITWPGVRASGSYTDKAGRTVYRFQIPKTADGKYSYVMFNSGSYANNTITEGKALTPGKNYVLDNTAANRQNYGNNIKAYALTPTDKAPNTTTEDYFSGSYIYIINNGTQNDPSNVNERKTLDEMHVVFYSDSYGANVIGNGSLNGYDDAGYIADKLVKLDGGTWKALKYPGTNYDVYRIQVPSNAKYFQINNGFGKGEGSSNYSLRQSEIKAVTPNGLYKFVEEANGGASKYIEGTTFPTSDETRQNPLYLLTLVQSFEESDEEMPTSGTVDVHIATIVTDSDGTQKYIKWLKTVMENQDGTLVEVVDTNYLNHTMKDLGEHAPNDVGDGVKTVKVKKDGSYYWKEVIPPSGYKINPNVTEFTISGYDYTNTSVPQVEDPKNPTGSLTLSKKLYSISDTPENDGEGQEFTFTVTLTAPIGTDWTKQQLTYTKGEDEDEDSFSTESDKRDPNSLTRVIKMSIPADGTIVTIKNIPSGTYYYVTETTKADYLSTPVYIYKNGDNNKNLDEISGTIPSDASSATNNVRYDVTNKRKVGSLTLAKTVEGSDDAALTAAEVTKGTTPFTYTVTLTAPTDVDLRNYLTWSSFSGIDAEITKVNGSDFTSSETNYNSISPTLSSIEFTVKVVCNKGSQKIENLPIGTKYTVTEEDVTTGGTGWTCEKTGEVKSGDNKLLNSENLDPVVTITNKYTTNNTPGPSISNEIILTKTAEERVGTTAIGAPLANAEFKLVKKSDTNVVYKFTLTEADSTDVEDKKTNVYTYTTNETADETSASLKTGEDGRLHIKNLPYETYYLEEINAPSGYSVNNKQFEFTVDSSTTTLNFTCSDEMAPAYIKLFEHINERRTANWGDPTFIFKITQTHYYNSSNRLTQVDYDRSYTVALTVNDDEGLAANDHDTILGNAYDIYKYIESTDEVQNSKLEYQGMYHIDNQGRIRLEPGKYTITRIPVSRYEFVADTWKLASDNAANIYNLHKHIEESTTKYTGQEPAITSVEIPKGETALVHYYDKVAYYDKFTHVDTEINQFYKLNKTTKANETIKGIRVEYKTKIPTSGESAAIVTTSDDFKAWFIYADGTEVAMDSTQKQSIQIKARDTEFSGKGNFDEIKHEFTIATPSNYASQVYTIKASYTYTDTSITPNKITTFTTNFDIAFAAATN